MVQITNNSYAPEVYYSYCENCQNNITIYRTSPVYCKTCLEELPNYVSLIENKDNYRTEYHLGKVI